MSACTQVVPFLCSDGRWIGVTVRRVFYRDRGEWYNDIAVAFPPGVLADDARAFCREKIFRPDPSFNLEALLAGETVMDGNGVRLVPNISE